MPTDLRHAHRALRRSPGFTLVAVLTLALGIGASTAVFSWMEGLVLNPFPAVRDPSRLVSVKLVTSNGPTGSMSYPEFAALRSGTHTLEGLTAASTVLGSVAALAVGQLLAGQLYGVRGRDRVLLTATAFLFALVALVASYIPARRATRVDPIIALRAD